MRHTIEVFRTHVPIKHFFTIKVIPKKLPFDRDSVIFAYIL